MVRLYWSHFDVRSHVKVTVKVTCEGHSVAILNYTDRALQQQEDDTIKKTICSLSKESQ